MLPTLFEFNIGSLTIPIHTYGLMIAIGFILAVKLMRSLAVREKISPDKIADLAFWCLVSGLAGGRILFVITRWEYFSEHPMDILKIWQGGLVFFGGLIGATLTALIILRAQKLSFWRVADVMLPGLTLSHVFGRFGCFGAGCCHGSATDVPWAVKLNSELVEPALRNVPIHPTQLYESFSLLLLLGILLIVFRRKKFDGQVALTYFMLYPILRSVIEVYRGDSIRGFLIEDVLSTSQAISIVVFLAALGVAVWRSNHPRAR